MPIRLLHAEVPGSTPIRLLSGECPAVLQVGPIRRTDSGRSPADDRDGDIATPGQGDPAAPAAAVFRDRAIANGRGQECDIETHATPAGCASCRIARDGAIFNRATTGSGIAGEKDTATVVIGPGSCANISRDR